MKKRAGNIEIKGRNNSLESGLHKLYRNPGLDSNLQ